MEFRIASLRIFAKHLWGSCSENIHLMVVLRKQSREPISFFFLSPLKSPLESESISDLIDGLSSKLNAVINFSIYFGQPMLIYIAAHRSGFSQSIGIIG
jgi:hypothetical protein